MPVGGAKGACRLPLPSPWSSLPPLLLLVSLSLPLVE
jgi:hypothetical protein